MRAHARGARSRTGVADSTSLDATCYTQDGGRTGPLLSTVSVFFRVTPFVIPARSMDSAHGRKHGGVRSGNKTFAGKGGEGARRQRKRVCNGGGLMVSAWRTQAQGMQRSWLLFDARNAIQLPSLL